MEELTMVPTSAGQICKVINPMDDENPEDVYVLTEDPTPFEAEDSLYFVNIKVYGLNVFIINEVFIVKQILKLVMLIQLS
jgi:hypothetical protein